MSEIQFNYAGNSINIQCNSDEKIEEIINKFIIKVGKKKENLYFIYSGGILNEELTFDTQANENDKKRNTMSVLVNEKVDDEGENEEESFKKSKYIICPECKENARILIDNYKINIYDCKNGHKKNNIFINDFEETQNYDESKIKCQICQDANKNSSYNNIFYICFECRKNLCPICNSKHEKTHNVIDYDDKFFICDVHYESYNSFCENCRKDLCMACEKEHNGHKIKYYGTILPDLKKIKEEIKTFNDKKEQFKNEIKAIINKLNNLMEQIEEYYRIYIDIINSYGNKKRNFAVLQNIEDINKFNNVIMKDIDTIITEKNFKNKLNSIFDIYSKINLVNENVEKKEENTNIINEKEKNINNLKKEVNKIEERINIDSKEKKTIEDIKEKEININEEKKENKKIVNNNDWYKIIYINDKLMMETEKNEDNNYSNFDVLKLKKILSIRTKIEIIKEILILKDGRILVYGDYLGIVCDLKNNKSFNLNIKRIDDIIQMDDGVVIVRSDEDLILIELNEDQLEIGTIKIGYTFKIFKLLNDRIMVIGYAFDKYIYGYEKKKIYKYENKQLKLIDEKDILSTKKIHHEIVRDDIYLIDENQIVIFYSELGLLNINMNFYLAFYDIVNDKKLPSFSFNREDDHCVGLINNNLLIFANGRKLYPIHLKNHSKKKEYKLENGEGIHSIISLNEKQFIVAQHDYINQFLLDKDNKFHFINSIDINNYRLRNFPKSRFIGIDDSYTKENIYIYGY